MSTAVFHYLLFVVIIALVGTCPLRMHVQYKLYLLPLAQLMLWFVCEGCPMNEKDEHGGEVPDIAMFLHRNLPLSVYRSKMLVLILLVGSLTVCTSRSLQQVRL